MLRIVSICGLVIGLVSWLATDGVAQFKLEKHEGGVRVKDGNTMVADYLTKSGRKPIIWPLIGAGGQKMTRDYPMISDSKDEAHDHPHQRSFWFTHGEVNDIDFWAEGEKMGITEHVEFTTLKDGANAVIASKNLWKSPAGKTVLSETRRITFGKGDAVRMLDCEFELTASDGDVHFGDTKEGSFGIRIAESMRVDAKGKPGGKIINSKGDSDEKAWGQPAEWVDYYGPVGDKIEGIAILCHPSSFHFPNRWHVRTYGLFAANPFGEYHFTKAKEKTAGGTLKNGEKLTLRYRVLLHLGDEKEGKVAGHYAEFAKKQFGPL